MEIIGDQRPLDATQRRRQAEAAAARASATGPARVRDAVDLGGFDAESVDRFVGILKGMDPASVHRVEDLRARIAAGTYTATPEELADALIGSGRF